MIEYENFKSEKTSLKKYDPDKKYNDFDSYSFEFNSEDHLPDNALNPTNIAEESIKVTKNLYILRNIFGQQKQVLQQIQDEQKIWWSSKYYEISNEKSKRSNQVIKRTKEQIESKIITENLEEYKKYNKITEAEVHKLMIVENAIKCLESFSFKLQNIFAASKKTFY